MNPVPQKYVSFNLCVWLRKFNISEDKTSPQVDYSIFLPLDGTTVENRW